MLALNGMRSTSCWAGILSTTTSKTVQSSLQMATLLHSQEHKLSPSPFVRFISDTLPDKSDRPTNRVELTTELKDDSGSGSALTYSRFHCRCWRWGGTTWLPKDSRSSFIQVLLVTGYGSSALKNCRLAFPRSMKNPCLVLPLSWYPSSTCAPMPKQFWALL